MNAFVFHDAFTTRLRCVLSLVRFWCDAFMVCLFLMLVCDVLVMQMRLCACVKRVCFGCVFGGVRFLCWCVACDAFLVRWFVCDVCLCVFLTCL